MASGEGVIFYDSDEDAIRYDRQKMSEAILVDEKPENRNPQSLANLMSQSFEDFAYAVKALPTKQRLYVLHTMEAPTRKGEVNNPLLFDPTFTDSDLFDLGFSAGDIKVFKRHLEKHSNRDHGNSMVLKDADLSTSGEMGTQQQDDNDDEETGSVRPAGKLQVKDKDGAECDKQSKVDQAKERHAQH